MTTQNTTASKLTDSLRRAKTTQEKPASKTTATPSRQKTPAKPVVKKPASKEESTERVKPMISKRVWPD
ncbi:hypothetical protein [Hydrogenovibrio thermophilus]|uniref:Uncharacterized protein n=1 Tax=Hydrogenovibrio thermophilus TaxID=265883 RepID=A0A410H304_9GAMM|nr:hypothetical protein [Hydrogenovibrio thermophilus]QAB15309.1 hypothetical protein EPV75_06320 [Hydrogenovibrio thermophilus]